VWVHSKMLKIAEVTGRCLDAPQIYGLIRPMAAVRDFILHHYRHFNAAALVDAAKAWEAHLAKGGKMFLTMAGAMSTAEMGLVT